MYVIMNNVHLLDHHRIDVHRVLRRASFGPRLVGRGGWRVHLLYRPFGARGVQEPAFHDCDGGYTG